tara:strand:- start:28868 stop:29602 length:735 start_codon:yes stop_codon:yes gene_type:complete
MKNYIYLTICILFLTISCGPSKSELAEKEKSISDSLEMVRQQVELEKKRVELERIHLENVEVGKSIKATKLNEILDGLKLNLTTAERNLEEINKFQIGRSQQEKNAQVKRETLQINRLRSMIQRVQKEVSLTKLFNSFEFQETPQGVVNHIFQSAKDKSYDKMRHLIDPYGEFDTDAFQLCYIEMYGEEGQQEWSEAFENGRIMGDPIYNEDKCTIEIAYGLSSDKLETINLVKRLNRWYMTSF